VDFPREGNANSFHHARRQWSLRDDDNLYYKDLNAFDGALMKCDEENGLMIANRNGAMPHVFHCKDDSGVLAFHCGSNLVVANLHPHESYPYYKVGSAHAGRYRLVLDTDAKKYGGWGRIDENAEPCTEGGMCDWQGTGVCLYVPSRSAQVYALVDEWEMPVDEWGVHHDADFGYDVDDWEHDTGGGGDDAVWF
jgi:1,4-alpha-glucan branching enzyme